MKLLPLWLLLPQVQAWWCDTSERTGCRGQPRQFRKEIGQLDPIGRFQESLSRISISREDEPLVVDWDKDGDLDVIVRTKQKLILFESRPAGFVQVEPNPFEGLEEPDYCRPALVDWNGDGHLDILLGTNKGIRYYQRLPMASAGFQEQLGEKNPFGVVAGGSICGDLSVADWDGDGDLDLLVVYAFSSMNYFQQVNGTLVLVNNSANPFQEVMEQTLYRRPVMADWNADGRMDLLLMPKVFRRMLGSWFNAYDCAVLLYLQVEPEGLGSSLEVQSNSVFLNQDCEHFKGSGLSLVDVDGDGDLDLVFGGVNAPLSFFEHKVSNGTHFLEAPKKTDASLMDLNQVELGTLQDFGMGFMVVKNFFKPTLVDWDLDGDLDLALVHLEKEKSRFFDQRDGKVLEVDAPPSNYSCPLDWRLYFSTADFDGDGLLDLLGFDENYKAVVCVRQGSDFVALETHPFRREFEAMEGRALFGFPSFVDWDGDGDVDVLKIEGDRLYLIENLDNSSFLRQLLPVPMARDFVAADFDEDGDVDLMMAFFNMKGCHYFERKGDGSLERLHGSDNPFESVCDGTSTAIGNSLASLATIGDWNRDGLSDLVVVYEKIHLWLNQEVKDFVDLVPSNDLIQFPETALQSNPRVSLVDADGDGDLDLVVPPQKPLSVLGDASYRYFEHLDSGELVERLGVANPFHGAPPGDAAMATNQLGSHMIVDVDGDGDLDIVRGYLQYAQQQDDGEFVFLEGADNPFEGIAPDQWDCWTLADWDEDRDMDLVVVERTNETTLQLLVQEYLAGRIHKDDFLAAVASKVRFYEQANSSFIKHVGAANPFHNMTLTADLVGRLCPSLVDMDKDGDLDLILEDDGGHLLFYEQRSKSFEILPGYFSEVSIRKRHNRKSFPRASHFVDWDGDGLMDLVNFEGDALQYFQRGVCSPVASYCKLGLCKQQALNSYKCECIQGAEGDDCSLCGGHHVREGNACKKCPGYKTLAGTCSYRGTCDDDSDARERQRAYNQSGFKVWSAIGTGECTCIAPFHGRGCREGLCPPGQRLERDTAVEQISPKYPRWDACIPCEAGRYKNHTGNEECSICPAGFISPTPHARTCAACPAGQVPTSDRLRCRLCDAGYVAGPGDPVCRPCLAGSAPDTEGAECVKCPVGRYAEARWSTCSSCPVGSVPDADDRGSCKKCDGQTYALPGDDVCKTCFFPAMILADENMCSPMYSVLFLLLFIVLLLAGVGVYSWLRLRCLKRKMDEQVQDQKWEDLHSLSTSYLEYGICRGRADHAIETRKEEVKLESLQLGISLNYVFQDLPRVYEDTAEKAEWRQEDCELTESGYFAKNRSRSIPQLESGWSSLPQCRAPSNPNFHQVAGILAYGPWALGKNHPCPRDGKMDCSIVDALQASKNSSKATWFLSWVWSYRIDDMHRALERWWDRHRQAAVSGQSDCTDVYIWWCVFVNNQFRMLEGNQVEEPEKLFSVFGKQLKGIGKMLMCFDKLKGCAYTTRIWCIFEVFVACAEDIPTTLIVPDVQVTGVNTLGDLTQECRVNAEEASAYFPRDAEAIKKHITEKHKGFRHVNQTVEKELWCEVIKYLESTSQPPAAPVTAIASPATVPVVAPAAQEVSEETEVLRKPRPPCCLQ